MKRTTVLVPLLLPRLSDKTAVQLIDILRAILEAIEHHYAAQIHRYRKRQSERQLQRAASQHSAPFDPPF